MNEHLVQICSGQVDLRRNIIQYRNLHRSNKASSLKRQNENTKKNNMREEKLLKRLLRIHEEKEPHKCYLGDSFIKRTGRKSYAQVLAMSKLNKRHGTRDRETFKRIRIL